MNNLNLFEALQILAKNYGMKAIKDNGCQIKWISQTLDNPPKDKIKQLVFVTAYGETNPNILTDILIEQQNYDCWSIVEDAST
ncbi:hypothetical protein ACFVS2_20975 [Brevibacillus sp. NPDC058079]|uniref:hypothetical protein n=1 Tax=Brevibacillus sp. NPDC058079 TaxID=3346330 RepID=UPI0036DFF5F4